MGGANGARLRLPPRSCLSTRYTSIVARQSSSARWLPWTGTSSASAGAASRYGPSCSRLTPLCISLRTTAISMIASRAGLKPVVSISSTQYGDASSSRSSGSTGRSTKGRFRPRRVKSVDPSVSTSWTPTDPIPATKPTANALRTLSVSLVNEDRILSPLACGQSAIPGVRFRRSLQPQAASPSATLNQDSLRLRRSRSFC